MFLYTMLSPCCICIYSLTESLRVYLTFKAGTWESCFVSISILPTFHQVASAVESPRVLCYPGSPAGTNSHRHCASSGLTLQPGPWPLPGSRALPCVHFQSTTIWPHNFRQALKQIKFVFSCFGLTDLYASIGISYVFTILQYLFLNLVSYAIEICK